jgi:osmoprotectant transport system ATP-binding protein
MINRLTEQSAGRIIVDGLDTAQTDPQRLRLSIGYAIQSVGLFPHLSVFDNIAVVPVLLRWKRTSIETRVNELLELVGLAPSEYARKYPKQLSGGEAQRIGVARALAAEPPVVLMDEPFGAVDPPTREKLQTQLLKIQQSLKKTIVLVTHDLDEAIRLADRIAVIESGRLLQFDTPEVVLSKPVNRFVRDYVGSDRALKQISRVRIKELVRPARSFPASLARSGVPPQPAGTGVFWLVSDDGRLADFVNGRTPTNSVSCEGTAIQTKLSEVALTEEASLKEALLHMLTSGLDCIPVIDKEFRLVGELTFVDVRTAIAAAHNQ